MAESSRATGSKTCKHQNVGQPSVLSYRLETAVRLWAILSVCWGQQLSQSLTGLELNAVQLLPPLRKPLHSVPLSSCKKMMNKGIAWGLLVGSYETRPCESCASLFVPLISVHAEDFKKCSSMFLSFPNMHFFSPSLVALSVPTLKTPLEVHCPPFLLDPSKTAGHICGSAYCFAMKTLLNYRMCFPPAAPNNSWCVTWINQRVPELNSKPRWSWRWHHSSVSGLALDAPPDLP